VPVRRLLCTRLKRAVAAAPQARCLLYYGFEFALGKGLALTVHATRRDLTVLGLQHGPITPGKIFYGTDPVARAAGACPDRLLLDGDTAQRTLTTVFGHPPATLIPVGALRRHPDVTDERTGSPAPSAPVRDGRRVALPLGLHDWRRTLEFVQPALTATPGIRAVVNLHPLLRPDLARPELERRLAGVAYDLDLRPIGDILPGVDLLITTFSTVGFDALAAGVPVVEIRPDWGIDWGLFAGAEDARVLARTPAELRAVLLTPDWTCFYRAAAAQRLLAACFGTGDAAVRCADYLAHTVGTESSGPVPA
jgi:hypothetical protein